jgi:uncharacterized protein YbjT (DUF2867 family)
MVTDRLLERGTPVRALSRSGRKRRGVEVFSGDIRDRSSLSEEAFRGLGGLVFSVEPGTANSGPERPETTMFQGVRNVLSACAAAGSEPHVVLVSQIYVTRPEHPINSYGRLLDWRLRGEQEVRESGLPYTIVRPSWFTADHPIGRGVRLEQGDTGDGKISVIDVADAVLQGLIEPAALRKTFELYNQPGETPDWSALLSRLQPDLVPQR